MIRLPRAKPGDVLTAERWNELCDAIEQALRITGPGVRQDRTGTHIDPLTPPPKFHVVLDEDLVDDGIATASVHSGPPGARVDTGINLEVSCFELELAGGTIEEGTYCTVAWVDGAWDVMKRSCP